MLPPLLDDCSACASKIMLLHRARSHQGILNVLVQVHYPCVTHGFMLSGIFGTCTCHVCRNLLPTHPHLGASQSMLRVTQPAAECSIRESNPVASRFRIRSARPSGCRSNALLERGNSWCQHRHPFCRRWSFRRNFRLDVSTCILFAGDGHSATWLRMG